MPTDSLQALGQLLGTNPTHARRPAAAERQATLLVPQGLDKQPGPVRPGRASGPPGNRLLPRLQDPAFAQGPLVLLPVPHERQNNGAVRGVGGFGQGVRVAERAVVL